MKRVLTAIVLIPLLIFAVRFSSPLLFTLLVAVASVLALQEFFSLVKKSGVEPYPLLGQFFGLALIASFHLCVRNQSAAAVLLIVAALSFLALGLSRGNQLNQVLPGAAVTLLGVVYIPATLGLLVTVRANTSLGSQAPRWILFFLSVVWLGDTAAYCVGKTLGRHKLAPRISPKKTVEGAVGGVVGNLLAALVSKKILLPEVPLLCLFLLSAIMGVAGQLGDLAESALKRGAGIKDSSNLLPGHGGLLDRIDAVLFAAPILFGYARFFL
jgi:phosphatidate cytidylyltransferase